MTRFKKEMMHKFSKVYWNNEDNEFENGAYVIEENALVVLYNPSLVIVLEYQRNGLQKDVTEDYPQISDPYLVHLCGGDIEKAKAILKSNHF